MTPGHHGALADLAHTVGSVQAGTYVERANSQEFGLVQAQFGADPERLATRPREGCALAFLYAGDKALLAESLNHIQHASTEIIRAITPTG
jgi:hypothetical protein